jgi:hypothetical protein
MLKQARTASFQITHQLLLYFHRIQRFIVSAVETVSSNYLRINRSLNSRLPPIQRVPEALYPGVKRSGREADHLPTSRMCGAIPPLQCVFVVLCLV